MVDRGVIPPRCPDPLDFRNECHTYALHLGAGQRSPRNNAKEGNTMRNDETTRSEDLAQITYLATLITAAAVMIGWTAITETIKAAARKARR